MSFSLDQFRQNPVVTKAADSGRELAATSQATAARAAVEAAYAVAIHRPRSVEAARQRILDACRREKFAAVARYAKPVGNRTVDGFGIRFAELALQAWGNTKVSSQVVFEDQNVRKILITVLDLENNTCYEKEISLERTVERSFAPAGAEILGQRLNSRGEKVHIIRATEADLQNKTASAESTAIRNHVLRLIPQDILSEAEDCVRQTLETATEKDKTNKVREIVDAFGGQGVSVRDLEAYLGHGMTGASVKEIERLRAIYQAIATGEAVWRDFESKAKSKSDDASKPVIDVESLVQKRKKASAASEPTPAESEPKPTPEPGEEKPKRGRGRPKKSEPKPTEDFDPETVVYEGLPPPETPVPAVDAAGIAHELLSVLNNGGASPDLKAETDRTKALLEGMEKEKRDEALAEVMIEDVEEIKGIGPLHLRRILSHIAKG